MPISFRCVCEKTLKVADKLAGKSVTCPACGTVISVPDLAPSDDPGFEVVEEPAPVAKLAMAKPVSKRPAVVDEDDELANDVPRKRRRRDDDDDDDDEVEERSRKRKRKTKKKEHSGWFATESWVLSGGVIGGALAMLVAIVWFVLGLLNNWLFYYPPILFIVGMIGVIKGLMSRGKDDD